MYVFGVAAAMILLLAVVNHFGVLLGAIVQNVSTFAKLAALGLIVFGGVFLAGGHQAADHGPIAAEILKPYVSDDVYWMIRAHQDFQGKHYYHHFGGDPEAREQYRGQPWFELAARFADEWDQTAFDPDYDTEPLEHFEPLVMELFASPKSL